MLGAAVCVLLLAGGLVAPSRAEALENAATTQYGQLAEGWHLIGPEKFGFFGSDGWYTGRWMTEGAFGRMAARLAYGAESGGTGIGTGFSANAAGGSPIWSELKGAATGAGTLATLRQLKGEGLSLMGRLKAFGVLRAIGDVALAATAFEVGYSVGGDIADLLFPAEGGDTAPPGAYTEATGFAPVEKGQELAGSAGITKPNHALALSDEFELTMQTEPGKAVVGAVALPGTATPECTSGETAPPLHRLPEGFSPVLVGESDCAGHPSYFPMATFVEPVEVACLPGEKDASCPGKPAETRSTAARTPEGAEPATKQAEECLGGLLGCTKLPGWWWNHDPEAKEDTHTEARGRLGLDPSDPLAVQIPDPELGETYTHYDARLEKLGLKPEAQVLAETAIDPEVGPEGVASTNPHIGSNVAPESSVKVRYNPADAPETSEENGTEESEAGTGGWTAPSIPAIDVQPLAEVGSPCTVFPFGVLCWVGETLTSWSGEGQCPKVSIPVGQGTGVDKSGEIGVDGCEIEPAMEIVRPVLVVLCTLTVGLWFSGWALGGGGAGGGED